MVRPTQFFAFVATLGVAVLILLASVPADDKIRADYRKTLPMSEYIGEYIVNEYTTTIVDHHFYKQLITPTGNVVAVGVLNSVFIIE